MAETEVESAFVSLEAWDPLAKSDDDVNIYAAAQKREIRNILKSYTGYYDLFSEMIQNALDAVERRKAEQQEGYGATIVVEINLEEQTVQVADNGCAMNLAQFKQFLKPNLSFKDGKGTRGNKGVGATYLAFGFNELQVVTKPTSDTTYAGVLKDGRIWIDDTQGLVPKPSVEPLMSANTLLASFDRGTSITLKLVGNNIRRLHVLYDRAMG